MTMKGVKHWVVRGEHRFKERRFKLKTGNLWKRLKVQKLIYLSAGRVTSGRLFSGDSTIRFRSLDSEQCSDHVHTVSKQPVLDRPLR